MEVIEAWMRDVFNIHSIQTRLIFSKINYEAKKNGCGWDLLQLIKTDKNFLDDLAINRYSIPGFLFT